MDARERWRASASDRERESVVKPVEWITWSFQKTERMGSQSINLSRTGFVQELRRNGTSLTRLEIFRVVRLRGWPGLTATAASEHGEGEEQATQRRPTWPNIHENPPVIV